MIINNKKISNEEQKKHIELKSKLDKTKQLIRKYESKFDDVPYVIEVQIL